MHEAYFTDRATWHRHQGIDALGDPLPTADIALRCRVDVKGRVVRDFAGVEVMAQASLVMTQQPGALDQFTVQGLGVEARRVSVAAVERAQDFATRYWKVWLV